MSHIHIIAAIKAKRAATKEYTESIESLFINELTRFIDENDEVIAISITNHVYTNNGFIYIPTDLDTDMLTNLAIIIPIKIINTSAITALKLYFLYHSTNTFEFMEPKISTLLSALEAKWNVKCIALSYNISIQLIQLAIQID